MINLKSSGGFSLLEIILAITILAIILIPMTGFVENTAGVIHKTDLQEKALLLGQQRLEELKTIAYDKLEKEAGVDNITDFDLAGIAGNKSGKFKRKIIINKLPFNNEMKEIIVEVSWADNKHKIELKTRVTGR